MVRNIAKKNALYWQLALAVALAFLVFQKSANAEGCFTVPTNRDARTYEDFKDLAQLQPPLSKAKHGVKRFLPFGGGVGDVLNIDFYYVTFSPAPGKSLQGVFKNLRQDFGQFARGRTGDFDFGPYADVRHPSSNDPILKENDRLWKSDDPTGAVMSFNLDTLWPSTFVGAAMGSLNVGTQDGDLQVTCATATDFVFSTAETDRGGSHPVAGNRGFGLKDNGDGTWMFYSKAADRRKSDLWKNKGAHLLHAVRLSGSIFCLGHKFWMNFFPNLGGYLGSNIAKDFFNGNHGPTPWPFVQGPQTPTMSCG